MRRQRKSHKQQISITWTFLPRISNTWPRDILSYHQFQSIGDSPFFFDRQNLRKLRNCALIPLFTHIKHFSITTSLKSMHLSQICKHSTPTLGSKATCLPKSPFRLFYCSKMQSTHIPTYDNTHIRDLFLKKHGEGSTQNPPYFRNKPMCAPLKIGSSYPSRYLQQLINCTKTRYPLIVSLACIKIFESWLILVTVGVPTKHMCEYKHKTLG